MSRRASAWRFTSEAPPVTAPVVSHTTPCAPSRRRCKPPVFFVMLSKAKMSGRLKASSEPSSFTAASLAASAKRDQDQGVGSAELLPEPFGRYDGHVVSVATGE